MSTTLKSDILENGVSLQGDGRTKVPSLLIEYLDFSFKEEFKG